MSDKLINQILEFAERAVAPLGLLVVDIRFIQAGRSRSLEIAICKPGGRVGLDDCEVASRAIETILEHDAAALLAGSYALEVVSPGIERELKTERELAIFTGQPVLVLAKAPLDGLGTQFTGNLFKADDTVIEIDRPSPVSTGSSRKPSLSKIVVEPPARVCLNRADILKISLHATEPALEPVSLVSTTE